jgi:hypothetical protein
VRIIVAIGILITGASAAFAQQQEGKLIDRLLRPNMALANPQQNKKFENTQTAAFNKPARTKSFSVAAAKPAQKTFSDQRTFTPQQFAARHFRAGDTAANVSTRSQLTKNDTVIATPSATEGTRVAPEIKEATPVQEFVGTRPFLDKGKSQKALSTNNRPLTIEEVRELLNKSK